MSFSCLIVLASISKTRLNNSGIFVITLTWIVSSVFLGLLLAFELKTCMLFLKSITNKYIKYNNENKLEVVEV